MSKICTRTVFNLRTLCLVSLQSYSHVHVYYSWRHAEAVVNMPFVLKDLKTFLSMWKK